MAESRGHHLCIQRRMVLPWVLMSLLILAEYCLFRQYVLREIIPYYPFTFDQSGYLQTSYVLYEAILNVGLKKAFLNLPLSPQSFLFPIQAAIAYLFFGASRLTALSLNFFYFAILQIFLFKTIKFITNRYLFSFLGLGIFLSTKSFFFVGGAFDFRIDFMALCLFGIFVCSVLHSKIFLIRKWVFISAGIAFFIIAIRFITLAYILGITLITCLYYCGKYDKRRIKNILLFAVLVILLISPILVWHHHLIYSYYVVGHYSGAEKLMRAKEAGVVDFFSNIFYYPKIFIQMHAGTRLFINLISAWVIFFICYLYFKINKQKKDLIDSISYSEIFIFLMSCIAVPIIILTLDQSKSVIVSGLVLIPFILFFIFSIAFLYQKTMLVTRKVNGLLMLVTLFFLVTGLNNFLSHMSSRSWLYDQRMSAVTPMINDIGNYAVKAGWQDIIVSADQIADYLIYPVEPFYYETHGILLNSRPGLGGTEVNAEKKLDALSKLMKSQVFIANISGYYPNQNFSFEKSIANYRGILKKTADKIFVVLGEYRINGMLYRVYVSPK